MLIILILEKNILSLIYMENSIEERLNDLKISFSKITDIKNEDLNTFSILEIKMNKLKELYKEFVSNNKNNLFVFGLDSFRFQSKLIDIEYDDMKRLFLAITNRMYCEYFKLLKIIIDYIKESVDDKKLLDFVKVNDKYPVYKDLEPFKQYDFGIIQNLHELLLTLLSSINNILIIKDYDLKMYRTKNNFGLNIDNFVNTFNFNNIVMREKVILFITYLEFFHKLHNKYFKRFTTKLQLMYSQITHDIKFDDNEESKKNKNDNMLNNLEDEEIGGKLLKELKASINDSNIDSESGSEFEMFENLKTPRSISADYDEIPKTIAAVVYQTNEILTDKRESNDLLDFSPIENKGVIINDDTNIKMEIMEVMAQIQTNIELTLPIESFENNEEKEIVEISFTSQENESREKAIEEAIEEATILVQITSSPITSTNDDELSVVTMESINGTNPSGSEHTNSSEEKKEEEVPIVKKKRTYKPRKKKETPPSE